MWNPTLKFTEKDALHAWETWGCNCGPSSLAATLGTTLDVIRHPCEQVGFAEKGYMSPTMMADAITIAGGCIAKKNVPSVLDNLCQPHHGLARIQWCGPWTVSGANPRWAYRQTHWVAVWKVDNNTIIFDVNGGLRKLLNWEREIVPAIVDTIPRADGEWFITHSWEIEARK